MVYLSVRTISLGVGVDARTSVKVEKHEIFKSAPPPPSNQVKIFIISLPNSAKTLFHVSLSPPFSIFLHLHSHLFSTPCAPSLSFSPIGLFLHYLSPSLPLSLIYQSYFPHPLTSPGQMSGGAIAGVVFGVLAVLALVLVAVFLVRRRRPIWRLESILRGNDSSDTVAFHNTVYSEGNDRGVVDFGQSA